MLLKSGPAPFSSTCSGRASLLSVMFIVVVSIRDFDECIRGNLTKRSPMRRVCMTRCYGSNRACVKHALEGVHTLLSVLLKDCFPLMLLDILLSMRPSRGSSSMRRIWSGTMAAGQACRRLQCEHVENTCTWIGGPMAPLEWRRLAWGFVQLFRDMAMAGAIHGALERLKVETDWWNFSESESSRGGACRGPTPRTQRISTSELENPG